AGLRAQPVEPLGEARLVRLLRRAVGRREALVVVEAFGVDLLGALAVALGDALRIIGERERPVLGLPAVERAGAGGRRRGERDRRRCRHRDPGHRASPPHRRAPPSWAGLALLWRGVATRHRVTDFVAQRRKKARSHAAFRRQPEADSSRAAAPIGAALHTQHWLTPRGPGPTLPTVLLRGRAAW